MRSEFKEMMEFRHACKEYDDKKKISDEDFDFILEVARLSPSSFGLEPWRFLVIQNAELKAKLLPYLWGGQRQIPSASHFIIALSKKSYFMKYDSEYVDNFLRNIQQLPDEIVARKGQFYKVFQQSDFDLLTNERAMTDWAAKQTYIPLANMMTAAASIGIDSCPIEGFDQKKTEAVLAAEMDIDPLKYSMAYALTFGYRKNEPGLKTRQTKDEVVSWYC